MSLEEPEDFPHALRFPLVNNQPSTGRIDGVAEHGRAAHPLALPPRRRHLVPCAFTDNLAFEFSETQENIQGQTAQRRGGVELLGHGNKAHCALIEAVHQPCEISQPLFGSE